MQAIIFLYLLDNSDGTSWMILFGQGMGILIEAWKITKTVDVRIRDAAPNSWLPYRVSFEDKHKLSETEKKTQEYDQIAFRYLYVVAVPLLGAYAVYSVLYESHKSWYSFVITTLVGSVYAYGFLMMVPSLYINYRLKVYYPLPFSGLRFLLLVFGFASTPLRRSLRYPPYPPPLTLLPNFPTSTLSPCASPFPRFYTIQLWPLVILSIHPPR